MSFVDKVTKQELLDNHGLRLKRLASGRVGAELASFAVAHTSVELVHKFLPNQYKSVAKKIAEKVIEPRIEFFDKLVKKSPALFREDADGKELKDMNKLERATLYAEDVLDLGMTIPLEMIAQGVTQSALDKKMGMPDFKHPDSSNLQNFFRGVEKQSEAVFADKAIQLGGIVAMNTTSTGRRVSDDMQDKLQPMLKKVFSNVGITEEGAERMSRQTISMGLPNLLGMAGSIGLLDKAYKNELAELVKYEEAGNILR